MTSDNRVRGRFETVEHPFGTIKARMGATHFLMKRLPNVATEMSLHVLACNLTRVISILGTGPLMAAMRAGLGPPRSEEHTSELQSLMRISYAVFCLKKKNIQHIYCTTIE